jgi:hypothetical protein
VRLSFRAPQVILFSQNVERAAAFYSSLGFSETFRVPTEGEPIHVDLTLDGYKIGIASVAMDSTRFPRASERPSSSGLTILPPPSRSSLRTEAPASLPHTSGSGVC